MVDYVPVRQSGLDRMTWQGPQSVLREEPEVLRLAEQLREEDT